MPAEISEEMKRAVKLLRAEGVPKKRTAIILGISRDTVGKYDDRDSDDWDKDLDVTDELVWEILSPEMNPRNVVADDQYIPDDAAGAGGDRISGVPPEETPLRDEADSRLRVSDDYASLSPGQFIEEFFDQMEVGVKSKFIRLQSRRAERRNEVPDEEKMRSDLEGMSSGITGKECEYVAEEYWAEAQKYLSESTAEVFRRGDEKGSSSSSGRGKMVSAGGPSQGDGQWYTMPDGSRQYGTMVPDGQGGQRFQPLTPPGQQGGPQPMMGHGGMGPQPQGGGQDAEVMKEMLREIRSMRESSDSQKGGLREQIEEFAQMQETLKQLQQGDDAGQNQQAVEVLRGELRQLRSELADGGGSAPQPQNSEEALFQRLLQRDDVSSDQLLSIADRIEGQSDPEVRKKEIDMQLEQQKMEMKRERTETVMDSLSGIVSQFGKAIGQGMVQSGDGGGQNQGQGQNQQPQGVSQQPPQGQNQQPQGFDTDVNLSDYGGDIETDGGPQAVAPGGARVEMWECPECGAETEQDPGRPGKECRACDYSLVPCPDCSMPIHIPPEDELERGGCPECDDPVMVADDPEEPVACLSCEWAGPSKEATGDTIECDHCGNTQPVMGGY